MKVLAVAILFFLSVLGMEQKIDEDTIPNLIAKTLLAQIYDKAVENLKLPDKICMVCLDKQFPVSFRFSCGHEICTFCAESIMKKCVNSNCPMCRKPLPKLATEWLTLIKIYPINLTQNILLENLQHVFPLICCVGNLTTVAKCVTMGVNVDTAGCFGYFPLHLASQTNVVKYLLDKRANINQVDHHGMTPLFMSCFREHLEIAKYLINKGANVNQATNTGLSPLYISCSEGYLPFVEYLINHGANVNQATNTGQSPLYISCFEGYLPLVEHLINHGANMNQATNDGWRPLIIAINKNHTEIAQLLWNKRRELKV